jgi:hypothetical protein
MKIKVEVTDASLDDVVKTVLNDYDEEVGGVTLGDRVVEAVVERLTSHERWPALVESFYAAVYADIGRASTGFVEALVEQEVTRQLESPAQGAVTRGAASTRVEAIVATEVTTQLRAKVAPVVEQSLTALRGHLNTLSDAAVQEFLDQRKGKKS